MKLSVIVPVYNVENYLRECLTSLCEQTLDDFEVLVVNDGSTDRSQEIIDEFVTAYPNLFTSLQKQNGGLGDARNYALPYVKGEYVTFLDSDDYVKKEAYQELYDLASEKQYDILMYDFEWFWEDGKREHRSSLMGGIPEFNAHTFILANPAACNKLFRSSLFSDHNIRFPVGLWYEDLACIPSLVQYGPNVGYLPKPYYQYRQRNASIMNSAYSSRLLEIIEAMHHLQGLFHDQTFHDELEFLHLYQLNYYASFRFLPYHKYDDIKQCLAYLDEQYPEWRKNPYYQRKPRLFHVYCECLANHHFFLASMLNKLRNGGK